MKDLTDYLSEQIEEKKEFHVDTFEKASWAIDKMAKKQTLIDKYQRAKDDYIKKINDWFDEMTIPLERDINNLGEMIRPYALQETLKSDKKSVVFPQGAAKFRTSESVQVFDEQELIKWLKETGKEDLVKVKETFSKADIKKLIKNGEIPPCTELVKKENYTVELKPIQGLLK